MHILKNVDLKKYTTVGVGGPAKYFCTVSETEKLVEAVNWAISKKLPYFILGGGSNVLISDTGFPGLVIKNNIKGIVGFKNILKVGTGTLLSQLIAITIKQNLSGLQKLAGIPGTVGGAICGNAGAYGVGTGDNITKVVCFDPQKNIIINLTKKQCQFGYRDSIFKKNSYIILEAHFKLTKTKEGTLTKEVKDILKLRAGKNFWEGKNPGSFFKNVFAENISPETLKLIPKDKIVHGKVPAGFLLESVGAKDQQIGNVKVSSTHANLFINLGNGKTDDFCKLAQRLMEAVHEKYGIFLEPEVRLINLPPLK